MQLVALKDFRHEKAHRAGDEFAAPDHTARALIRRGLAREATVDGPERPTNLQAGFQIGARSSSSSSAPAQAPEPSGSKKLAAKPKS